MSKSEFTMLAHKYNPVKVGVAGWFVSEKLDGMRAVWDGGVSRGMLASSVPYANTEKDSRFVTPPVATGLYSRYANPISAPDWFLDLLPVGVCLDGELWAGVQTFQLIVGTVKRLVPGPEWELIQYRVFDSPAMFFDREIKTTNLRLRMSGCDRWVRNQGMILKQPRSPDFETVYDFLKPYCNNKHLVLHPQQRLAFNTRIAESELEERLTAVTAAGGEGLILRKPSSIWVPERSHSLLKVKKMQDMEGMVIGYTSGREAGVSGTTGLVTSGKLLGLMGSLRLRLANGKIFDLSGFTDSERVMHYVGSEETAEDYLAVIPGQVVDVNKVYSKQFPIGSRVTFLFREMSDDGLPREARYLRRR